MTNLLRLAAPIVVLLLIGGCGFATYGHGSIDPPGFFQGIWHGLLAPWTLILRLFFDITMYAIPNTGWFYDLGFLIGVVFSIPLGWLAALVAIVVHIL